MKVAFNALDRLRESLTQRQCKLRLGTYFTQAKAMAETVRRVCQVQTYAHTPRYCLTTAVHHTHESHQPECKVVNLLVAEKERVQRGV